MPVKRIDEIRRVPTEPLRTRRERPGMPADAGSEEDAGAAARGRSRGRRVRRGLIPQSRAGRILAGIAVLGCVAAVGATWFYANRFIHNDPRFLIRSSSSIELHGNQHLTRAQLLSIFGGDIDGNIFDVPMANRRDQLEQIPWVEHATVMRLLPNRVRVDVRERTPIAFVRQGGNIGMADANGVLLDIPPDAPGNPDYSFPVVTGLKPDDSPESREQRMHLFSAFLKDLDSGSKKISSDLSEVDLSDPEDVKALLPNANGQTLVHFGAENFLHRYQRFQEHISEWRSQYPRLSSVDMRYERQVVLQMPPKDSTVTAASTATPTPANAPARTAAKASTKPPAPAPANKPVAVTAHNVFAPPPPAASRVVATRPPQTPKPATATTIHPRIVPLFAHREERVRPHPLKSSPKQTDLAKRLEATKAWMARRQHSAGNAATTTP